MDFEFDPVKSAANLEKHGIDFLKARQLWNDPRMIHASARTDDEPRYFALGMIDGSHWAAVCVQRSDRIRIISVRRARPREIEIYEGQ